MPVVLGSGAIALEASEDADEELAEAELDEALSELAEDEDEDALDALDTLDEQLHPTMMPIAMRHATPIATNAILNRFISSPRDLS